MIKKVNGFPIIQFIKKEIFINSEPVGELAELCIETKFYCFAPAK